MATREQYRAQKAFNAVERIAENNNRTEAENYGRQCMRLPVLLHNSGLCQTVAFFLAKGNGDNSGYFHKALCDLADVMNYPLAGDNVKEKAKDFNSKIIALNLREYQRWSREALAAADWLKRYVEALIKIKDEN